MCAFVNNTQSTKLPARLRHAGGQAPNSNENILNWNFYIAQNQQFTKVLYESHAFVDF
jgi:hypothetical protein